MTSSKKPLLIRVKASAIDDPEFSLGIVRLDLDKHVTFMNRALQSMVGDEIRIGSALSSIPFDAESRAKLEQVLNARFELERGSAYPLQLRRTDNNTLVTLHVSAVPEYDAEGVLVGSVGLVADESIDSATSGIHRIIQSADQACALYTALTEELHKVISFDSLRITGISRNRNQLQRLYESPTPPQEILPRKWWPIHPFIKAMIEPFQAGPLDLEALYASPDFREYERSDAGLQQFRERGFRHALRLGVYRASRLVATVTLLRCSTLPFSAEEHAHCVQLPIAEAVNAAMALDEQSHLRFSLELIDSIARGANSIPTMAQCLVDRLAAHYGWEHVSLFRVDENRRQLRMVCQAGSSSHRLPEGYEQPYLQGLLGKAYFEGRAVNVGNVHARDVADTYVVGIAGTESELVLPIPGEQKHWLLNIEASLRDSFADEEQSSIETLLRVAGVILDRTAALELRDAVLDSVSDAVIQTDALGVIQNANRAAGKLLRCDLEQLKQRNISTLIDKPEPQRVRSEAVDELGGWDVAWTGDAAVSNATLLLQDKAPQSAQVDLLVHGGHSLKPETDRNGIETVRVLMSVSPLESEFGGKVFVATDMSHQLRIERLGMLKQALSQISNEIRVPLGLAATFLTDSLANVSVPHELVQKSLRQLRKADVPLERFIRLAATDDNAPLPRVPLDLRATVSKLVEQLPQAECASVHTRARDEEPLLVSAAHHELNFCLQSLIAYLLRTKAQAEHIEVLIGKSAARAFILMTRTDRQQASPAACVSSFAKPGELALPENLIRDLMDRMGGAYHSHHGEPPCFRLVVPLGEQDHELASTNRA